MMARQRGAAGATSISSWHGHCWIADEFPQYLDALPRLPRLVARMKL